MKEIIQNRVYQFFIESDDFNGIPLRLISDELSIGYEESIDIIKELVSEEIISIQSSENPHIVGIQYFPIEYQLRILEDAKNIKVNTYQFGEIIITSEDTEFSICLYPSQQILKAKRDLSIFNDAVYAKQLALGEPQLKPIFFEIEVLDRYIQDPRFEFKFEDYSGSIYYKIDKNGKPVVRSEDEIFLKTFGLGFDADNNRLAVVYLRYLKDLTNEHQVYWKSKELKGNCKILAEYYENTALGRWDFCYSVFTAFIWEQKCLNELSYLVFGKKIFNKTFEDDNRPREFTFFFVPTLKNYNEFVLLLDKMISDNINKPFFEGDIDFYDIKEIENGIKERIPKGTLRLFEEWLSSKYNTVDSEISKIFKPFKNVRKERQSPAHKISENSYDQIYIGKQKELIQDVYYSMKVLRNIFQRHPKAYEMEIPSWLDNGKIKVY